MRNQRPEPPPFGGIASSEGEANCRYMLTYDGTEDAHESDFESWLLEWMLAWTEDPDVRRVDAEPAVDGGRDRIRIDTDRRDCVVPDQHRRLVRDLCERVTELSARCEPPLSAPYSVDIERDCAIEVHG
ncbi:hypothetical protein [Halorubrum sp. DTA98]|uniref:hypothetical protein n=1 Tax=Halorubrum sp. DTA98 TaxID=3402163 RepID=UPI003AB0D989